jgi:NAD(P)-dependent dehydrogenase (short-subunit alcohol dehydrogenase family)
MKRLKNKVCVITGGASGIGYASVLRFLAEGARVVLVDVNKDAAREKVEEIADRGDEERIRFWECDVSDEVQVLKMVRYAVEEFGRIDCMFNNAGVGGAYGRLIDTRVEDWDRTQAYLLRSTFLCIKHAASAMIRQKTGGSIVNNAALAAHIGDVAGAAYSAAKAGVVSVTKTAAVQLAEHRIRVNSISPGFITTPLMHRDGDARELEEYMLSKQAWPEVGRPEHVASVAAFLAGDESGFITGADLVVDGGYAAGGRGLYGSGHALGKAIASRMEEAGVRHFDFGTTGLKESPASFNGKRRPSA